MPKKQYICTQISHSKCSSCMKIKSLHISNFRGLHNIDIDELDKQSNLFVGINGAGKSSVLDALSCLLSRYTKRISSSNGLGGSDIAIDDVSISTKEGTTISLTTDENITWTLYRSRELIKDGKSDLSQLNIFLKELRNKLVQNPHMNLTVVAHYKVSRAVASIPLKIRKYKSSELPIETYFNALDGNTLFRDFFSWFREQEDIENEEIRDNREYRDRGLEAIRNAMYSIFPEYTDMRVKRHPQSLQLKKGDKQLKLNQLSDGEKCYIALVCDLTRRLTLANPSLENPLLGDGIVLIDEIDLHLHPQWQLSIITKLTQTFPNCQFIFTTHSPIVASDTKGKVFGLVNGEIITMATYGYNVDEILLNNFNLPYPRSTEVQQLIKKTSDAIHKNKVDDYKDGINKLGNILGQDNTVILNLRLEYLQWNKLCKK